jgi:hypothetical protein
MSVDALLKLHDEVEILLRKKAGERNRSNAKQAPKYRGSKARIFRKQASPKARAR